jgi:hypothetical protein
MFTESRAYRPPNFRAPANQWASSSLLNTQARAPLKGALALRLLSAADGL